MGFLWGLLPFFGWSVGDIFGAFASRKIGAYKATAYVFIFGFILSSLLLPFFWRDFWRLSVHWVIFNIIIGTACLIGNLLLNESFRRSSTSLVGIIVQSFPAVTLLLSAIIFKDPLSVRQIVWVLLIFMGVFLCSVNIKDLIKVQLVKDSGVQLALIASVIFALYFTFFRLLDNQYGWFWANYISFASFPLALYLSKKFLKTQDTIGFVKDKKITLAILLSAILLRSGDVGLNVGIAQGFSSITAPLAGASPVLFVFLSSLIYKDPITKQQKMGIGISLVGIVLLSFFS